MYFSFCWAAYGDFASLRVWRTPHGRDPFCLASARKTAWYRQREGDGGSRNAISGEPGNEREIIDSFLSSG